MIRVNIESPYQGDIEANLLYLARCMRDSLYRGEAPYASHALYTLPGCLHDSRPNERELGLRAGDKFREMCHLTVFMTDYGWSDGMKRARAKCDLHGYPYEMRQIGVNK
jgi:hypothetical protein